MLEAIFEDEVRLVMDEAKEGVTFHDAYARVAAIILNNREDVYKRQSQDRSPSTRHRLQRRYKRQHTRQLLLFQAF